MITTLLILHLATLGGLTPEQQEEIRKVRKESTSGKPPDGKKAGADLLVNGHEPRTCLEKCESLKNMMTSSTDRSMAAKHSNAGAKKATKDMLEDMAENCAASCKAKGVIDPEYMKDHMKKAKPPPGRDGPWHGHGGGGGGESDGAASNSGGE